jgi:hypothetical protein
LITVDDLRAAGVFDHAEPRKRKRGKAKPDRVQRDLFSNEDDAATAEEPTLPDDADEAE